MLILDITAKRLRPFKNLTDVKKKGEMAMKKDNINEKETENKDAAPLLDGELENVAGGYTGHCCMRWECYECGAHGRWFEGEDFVEQDKNGHTRCTGHTGFRTFYKRFDGPYDPSYEDIPSFSDHGGSYKEICKDYGF
jgi:hypothetical protein